MNERERFRKLGWLIVGLLVGATIMTLVTATARTQVSVTEMREVAQGNAKVLRAIKDCTTPGRKCYERSRRSTAQAISSINEVAILAAACAAQAPDPQVRIIQRCVLTELSRTPRRPSP